MYLEIFFLIVLSLRVKFQNLIDGARRRICIVHNTVSFNRRSYKKESAEVEDWLNLHFKTPRPGEWKRHFKYAKLISISTRTGSHIAANQREKIQILQAL